MNYKNILTMSLLILTFIGCAKKDALEDRIEKAFFLGSEIDFENKTCSNMYTENKELADDRDNYTENYLKLELRKEKCPMETGNLSAKAKCIPLPLLFDENSYSNSKERDDEKFRHDLKNPIIEKICYTDECISNCNKELNTSKLLPLSQKTKPVNSRALNSLKDKDKATETSIRIIQPLIFLIIGFLLPIYVKRNMIKNLGKIKTESIVKVEEKKNKKQNTTVEFNEQSFDSYKDQSCNNLEELDFMMGQAPSSTHISKSLQIIIGFVVMIPIAGLGLGINALLDMTQNNYPILLPVVWILIGSIFLAVLVKIFLTIKRKKYSITQGYSKYFKIDRSLLLLRVFNSEKITDFLFFRFEKYWNMIANTFTIVDPSLVKYDFTDKGIMRGGRLRGILYIFLIFAFVLFSLFDIDLWILYAIDFLFPNINREIYFGIYVVFLFFLFMVSSLLFMKVYIDRIFIKSSKDLKEKIQKLTRSNRFYCYDNVWKEALSTMVSMTSIIVMDLRAFSRERSGCEFEIKYLLNKFPIEKILFILDESSDIIFFKEVLSNTIEAIEEYSPNYSKKRKVLTCNIYKTTEDKEELDARQLCKFLLNLHYEYTRKNE